MKAIACVLLFFTFASVGFSADDARSIQEEDIRAAAFRWQFEHNGSYQQGKAKVYFLEVGEKEGNPSDKLLKRFAGNKPPVRKRSRCSVSTRGVFDRKTGEKGLVFRVTSIEWKSDTLVQVKGGYNEHGLSASGNTYTLVKKNGKWEVTDDTMDWIS